MWQSCVNYEMAKNPNLSGNLFTKQQLTIKETPLSKTIAEWLNVHRIYNDRINSGKVEVVKRYPKNGIWTEYRNWMTLAKTGTPDRFAIYKGRIIFIEVKQKGKKPTSDQLERQQELIASGSIVINTDSVDDFIAQFKAIQSNI